MRAIARTTIVLALLFAAAGSAGAAQVTIGIRIGRPPAPRVVRMMPPRPGPAFIWVEGYWYPVGHRYRWHDGYWTRPPYRGARWVGPRHDDERFYSGYWDGPGGRVRHEHRWDRERERDFRRWHRHPH